MGSSKYLFIARKNLRIKLHYFKTRVQRWEKFFFKFTLLSLEDINVVGMFLNNTFLIYQLTRFFILYTKVLKYLFTWENA